MCQTNNGQTYLNMNTQSIAPILNETALQYVRTSLPVKSKLQLVLNKSARTLVRYIKANDPKLADSRALKIISEETGVPQEKLIQVA